jgi:RHS repeat-associated protein
MNFSISSIFNRSFDIISLALLATLSIANIALADDDVLLPDYEKRQNVEERLQVLGNGLMGDQIDPSTGALVFSHTDIDIPGNFELPVRLERKRSMGETYRARVDVDFGDWVLNVPKITATTISEGGWKNGGARCSADFNTSFPNSNFFSTYISHDDYHNGISMDAPGAGSRAVLYTTSRSTQANSQNTTPQFPSTAKFVSTDNWYFTCISASDGGEGILGHAPNGDKYRFDHVIVREGNDQRYSQGGRSPKGRFVVSLMATQVTDVHGNTVIYNYDSLDRLTYIQASDGRRINLTYSGSDLLIRTATIQGTTRTWNYAYRDTDYIDPDWLVTAGRVRDNQVLETVTQPDQNQWIFDIDGMYATPKPNTQCPSTAHTLFITHPYGTEGEFHISPRRYRVAEVSTNAEYPDCPDPSGPEPGQLPPPPPPPEIAKIRSYSIASKTLNYSGRSEQWTYGYSTNAAERTNVTTFTDPEGDQERFEHYWSQLASDTHLEGKLRYKEYRDVFGNTLASETYEYVSEEAVGSTEILTRLSPQKERPVRQTKTIQIQDGDTFTTESNYESNFNNLNYSFGLPVERRIYSNVSTTPRITELGHFHDKTQWILGQTESVVKNGRPTLDVGYNPKGQVDSVSRYGTLTRTFGYNPSNGTLAWVKDALLRETSFQNWKRGVAQIILRPDGETEEQNVDNNAWLTSKKDARGNITTYQHDNMGRLTLISPPAAFADTAINYNFGPQSVVQTITKGQSKVTIDYDTLFQPQLEKTEALDSGWVSYVRSEYDGLGRKTFQSFPSLSATENAGSANVYDGLGRVKSVTETVAPYASTVTEYLSGHSTRVTDPEGNQTTTHMDGYKGPGKGDVVRIEQPLGIQTLINRNIWGEMESVTQSGTSGGTTKSLTHEYEYDTDRRLCRYYTPEGGATLYDYDIAGQLIAYAKGQPNAGCVVPNDNSRVTLSYDDVGRLETTLFGDNKTPNITRTYDPDGNVLTVNRGTGLNAVDWTYTYDEMSNLKTETLLLDSKLFGLAYQYNTSSHLTHKTLPTGDIIAYYPDGLGRTTEVEKGTDVLAYGVNYHATGKASSFTYGNGIGFTQNFNARLLPEQFRAYKSVTGTVYCKPGATNCPSQTAAVLALDLTYTYDKNGRVKTITDAAVTNNDRSYNYDGLGRLDSATGPWGASSYSYDALGNILSKTEGSRAVSINYDLSKNRPTQSNDSGVTGIRTIAYDSRGNVTTLGQMAFDYDLSDQPISVSGTMPNGENVPNATSPSGGFPYGGFGSGGGMNSQSIGDGWGDDGDGGSGDCPFWTCDTPPDDGGDDPGNPGDFPGGGSGGTGGGDGNGSGNGDGTGGNTGGGTTSPTPPPASDYETVFRNYVYDGNLKRVKSTINGKRIYNIYDASGALVYVEAQEDDPNGSGQIYTETAYVSGPMGTLARIKDGTITYLHPDHLGSAVAGTDSNSAVAWRESYTPYGEAMVINAANDNQAGFTGHIKDATTGLNYMQARYYDPVIGRFLSIDQVTFMDTGKPGMFNRYAYTLNNPINMIDPDGNHPIIWGLNAVHKGYKGYKAGKKAHKIYKAGKVRRSVPLPVIFPGDAVPNPNDNPAEDNDSTMSNDMAEPKITPIPGETPAEFTERITRECKQSCIDQATGEIESGEDEMPPVGGDIGDKVGQCTHKCIDDIIEQVDDEDFDHE